MSLIKHLRKQYLGYEVRYCISTTSRTVNGAEIYDDIEDLGLVIDVRCGRRGDNIRLLIAAMCMEHLFPHWLALNNVQLLRQLSHEELLTHELGWVRELPLQYKSIYK